MSVRKASHENLVHQETMRALDNAGTALYNQRDSLDNPFSGKEWYG